MWERDGGGVSLDHNDAGENLLNTSSSPNDFPRVKLSSAIAGKRVFKRG